MKCTYQNIINLFLVCIECINIILVSQLSGINSFVSFHTINIINNFSILIICTLYLISLIVSDIKTSDFIYLIFMIFIVLLFKSSYVLYCTVLALIYSRINIFNIIKNYKFSVYISTIVIIGCSLLGLVNRFSPLGVLTLGFVNENGLGYYLAIITILSTINLSLERFIVNKQYYWFALIISCFLVFCIKDYTALLIIWLYFLLIKGFYSGLFKKVRIVFIILPLLLSIFSFWCGENFLKYQWLQYLNNIITKRFFLWNYYLTKRSIPLLGKRFEVDITADGRYWSLDGSYMYYMFAYGLLFAVIMIVGLCLANYYLLKSERYIFLSLLLVLEVSGFSENFLFNYNMSFGAIIALLGYFFFMRSIFDVKSVRMVGIK